MKTFIYFENNGNASITLKAKNFREANQYLNDLVKDSTDWTVEDEQGS